MAYIFICVVLEGVVQRIFDIADALQLLDFFGDRRRIVLLQTLRIHV